MLRYSSLIILLFITLPVTAGEMLQKTHHQLRVALDPGQGSLTVRDSINMPSPVSRISLQLHAELTLDLADTNASIIDISPINATVPVNQYTIQFTRPSQSLTLEYTGKISHQPSSRADGYAGGRNSTPGLISKEGVFLSGSSYWYPRFAEPLLSFSLTVALPGGWTSISQGEETESNHWTELQPQDDIYLIAAPFHVYQKETPVAMAQVFLMQADEELARRYLNATETYLNLFQSLLGDYPYSKFALVENFWETGYGMPSFTLLGSRVIRLPFILYSSYPHEILHNWWGNSVYINYSAGNWAEGLTSYLADHLLQEQKGKGADYRRNSLQKYAAYVADASDFPLTEFVAHHGEVSQAIGYSKALMMFHMLRKKLGDAAFIAGLRSFYQDNKFQFAGYEDLRHAFEQENKGSLADFFNQWTSRTGAPVLALDKVSATRTENTWHLNGRLRQTQPGGVFRLNIPVFVQLQGHREAMPFNLQMNQKSHIFELELPARPLKISVDPRFELFRKLLPEELPASLAQMFGASEISILLPSGASNEMKKAWQDLAFSWQQKSSDITVLWDDQLGSLPENQALWIFGKENRFVSHIEPTLMRHGLGIESDSVNWQGQDYPLPDHSLALVANHPDNRETSIGFISTSTAESLPTLARKLPHYGRYSMTLFSGTSVNNLLKVQWPLTESPLQVSLTKQKIPPIAIPPLQPLVR
jgi:aminopeptidase N